MILALSVILTCTPIATDGDTLRCGAERIRLLGIDAPEMPGHCRSGRKCASGDPMASQRNLSQIIGYGSIRIERVGHDRYGRTLGLVSVAGVDLSCWQLRSRMAVYKRAWDNAGRVRAICPTDASPR